MLKILVFSIMISFAILCLNCSDLEPSKNTSGQGQDGLYVKCMGSGIMPKKTLVGTVEVYEREEFAVLTNSNGKTHIHLDKIVLNCAATEPNVFKINHAVEVDTLKLHGEYYMNIYAGCSCNISLDLTIESIGDDIKYLTYSERDYGVTDIFPVKYQ